MPEGASGRIETLELEPNWAPGRDETAASAHPGSESSRWTWIGPNGKGPSPAEAEPTLDAPPDLSVREERLSGEPEFRSARAARLWRWWQRAGAGGVPSWSAFDIAEHPSLAAHVFVARRVGEEFHYRILGEVTKLILGPRLSRDVVIRPGHRGALGHDLHGYYRRVLASGACWRCTGWLLFDGWKHRRFEAIDAPLVRCGGEPDTVLGVIDLVS